MQLYENVVRQMESLFGISVDEKDTLMPLIEEAKRQALESLSAFDNKYFKEDINPFNSVMYCNFLYWLGRQAFKRDDRDLADKIYYLNKTLNNVELYYEIELPRHWNCEHPLGAVLGKAKYGDRFFFYQGCTVGGNHKGPDINYPVIGSNVWMYSNSKILGSSIIGNNVILSANAYVINERIPDNVMVFGQSPDLKIKKRSDTDRA